MKRPGPPRLSSLCRALTVSTLIGACAVADTSVPLEPCAIAAPAAAPAAARGRLLVLPGVGNTSFVLSGFKQRAERLLPGFDVEVRTWGTPLLPLANLRSHERNLETARRIAADITAWRAQHPGELLYLVGYSGGGGIASLVVSELPVGVTIDRLVLVAPAIAPDFAVESRLAPHVEEFIVNYSSPRDLQVGLGTRVFGTIDRVETASAGAVGFTAEHAALLEWRWTPAEQRLGHPGNHLAYLTPPWQHARLLPALDPRLSAAHVEARWRTPCRSGS